IAGETLSAPSTGRVSREFPGREISIVSGQANAWQKDASMCCFVLFQWPVNKEWRRNGNQTGLRGWVLGFGAAGAHPQYCRARRGNGKDRADVGAVLQRGTDRAYRGATA